jgi:hypothetical protein
MKLNRLQVAAIALAIAPFTFAQKWEFGGGVGGGFYSSQDVTSSAGSAAAKLQTNIAGGAWFASNNSGHWGGELRYEYQLGDLQLASAGTTATFAARTHQFHYDVLWYARPSGAKVRPFVAVGAGVKVYQGTGAEVVYQPLSQFALLTKAQDLTPLASAGAGVKFRLGSRLQVRVEVHDYLTPFPTKVIAPNVGVKTGGWLQDIVPMIGFSWIPRTDEN